MELSRSYTPNSLNQYAQITSGGVTESPAHDDDGNMLSDAGRTYAWNAENRLVSSEPKNSAEGKKVGCLHDHMGRRVRKTVFAWDGGAWAEESGRLFVYDG